MHAGWSVVGARSGSRQAEIRISCLQKLTRLLLEGIKLEPFEKSSNVQKVDLNREAKKGSNSFSIDSPMLAKSPVLLSLGRRAAAQAKNIKPARGGKGTNCCPAFFLSAASCVELHNAKYAFATESSAGRREEGTAGGQGGAGVLGCSVCWSVWVGQPPERGPPPGPQPVLRSGPGRRWRPRRPRWSDALSSVPQAITTPIMAT